MLLTVDAPFPEWLPPLIFLPILALIIIASVKSSRKRKELTAAAKNEMERALKDFTISKELQLTHARFLVDDKHKRFAYIVGNSAEIYNYSELIDFELNEDGNTLIQGRGVATAVGAATFGIAGAVVGASGKKKVKSTCTSMDVYLMLNNLQKPQLKIPFIYTEVKKNSLIYSTNLKSAQDLIATLTYIKNQNNL